LNNGLVNAGALGWRLTEEEVVKLDGASDNVLGMAQKYR
jgi:hypothetical protein